MLVPASRVRVAVLPQHYFRKKPENHRAFHLYSAAPLRADASTTMKQYQASTKVVLKELCREHGLSDQGLKKQLSTRLYEHFHPLAEYIQEGNNAAQVEKFTEKDLKSLVVKVSDLDSAIKTRTKELHNLHAADRETLSSLTTSMADLKTEWGKQLEKVSGALENAVSFQESQIELNRLNKHQEKLEEELRMLSSQLKQRDGEIEGLQSQLAEVRKEREIEGENNRKERLAALALASHAVASDGSSNVQGDVVGTLRSMYVAPDYVHSPVPTLSNLLYFDREPEHAPRTNFTIFGPAAPGIAICAVLGKLYSQYTQVRDSVFAVEEGRVSADVASAALAVALCATYIS